MLNDLVDKNEKKFKRGEVATSHWPLAVEWSSMKNVLVPSLNIRMLNDRHEKRRHVKRGKNGENENVVKPNEFFRSMDRHTHILTMLSYHVQIHKRIEIFFLT
jgi:hypothetical protein